MFFKLFWIDCSILGVLHWSSFFKICNTSNFLDVSDKSSGFPSIVLDSYVLPFEILFASSGDLTLYLVSIESTNYDCFSVFNSACAENSYSIITSSDCLRLWSDSLSLYFLLTWLLNFDLLFDNWSSFYWYRDECDGSIWILLKLSLSWSL